MQPSQFKAHVDRIAEAINKWRNKHVDPKHRQQVLDRLQALIDKHSEQIENAAKLIEVCRHRREYLLVLRKRAKEYKYISPEKVKEEQ